MAWEDEELNFDIDADVDATMLAQEEVQRKIEAFEKIDEDVKNGISPF